MAIIGAILDREIRFLANFALKKKWFIKNTGTIGPFSLPSGYLLHRHGSHHHAIFRTVKHLFRLGSWLNPMANC